MLREQLTSFLQSVLGSLAGELIALSLIIAGTTACLLHAEENWQTAGKALVVAGTTRLGTKL
jgi:hypothetical protein